MYHSKYPLLFSLSFAPLIELFFRIEGRDSEKATSRQRRPVAAAARPVITRRRTRGKSVGGSSGPLPNRSLFSFGAACRAGRKTGRPSIFIEARQKSAGKKSVRRDGAIRRNYTTSVGGARAGALIVARGSCSPRFFPDSGVAAAGRLGFPDFWKKSSSEKKRYGTKWDQSVRALQFNSTFIVFIFLTRKTCAGRGWLCLYRVCRGK